MHALIIDEFGPPDVLRLGELAVPEPAPGQVLIKVAFAGVNYFEVLQRQGAVPGVRTPLVPGLEVSGTIAATGPGVEEFQLGQAVAAMTGSGYAEYATTDARLVVPLHDLADSLGFEKAAAMPITAVTAYQVLADVARLRRGETVLVHGASGGVGTMTGQIAQHLGAGTVIGTLGDRSREDYARKHGYDEVLARESFVADVLELTEGRGVDVVVEMGGGEQLKESFKVLAPFGRIAYIGSPDFSTDAAVEVQHLRNNTLGVLGYSIGGLSVKSPQSWRPSATAVLDLLRSGELSVSISGTYPLAEAADAHRLLESRGTAGKLLLRTR